MFFKGTFSDLRALLVADINSVSNVKNISRDEIYTTESSYLEIVGMKKRTNLFKWFLSSGLIDAFMFKQKTRFNKQSFSTNSRIFTIYN